MSLSMNARTLLAAKYTLPGETPGDVFLRVARAVGTSECSRFYQVMKDLAFLPNSPTLMNAGLPRGQLAACFVLPVEDSIQGIFRTLGIMAQIHKTGGGTGFSFSKVRPSNDQVGGRPGVAGGPLPFIRVFDEATNALRQGGRRRGANMGVLASSHPDILAFIDVKRRWGLDNFNLSVGFDGKFFECLSSGREYGLVNPRNREIRETIAPGDLWDAVARAAWSSGDPGMLFFDRINEKNTVPGLGPFEATNPCGEQPLLPFESCNLGSINLSQFLVKGDIDEERIRETARLAVRFLDAVIDATWFPTRRIREATLRTRKIGLGVMGLADLLIRLDIPYSSDEAVVIAGQVMSVIQDEAKQASYEMGVKKGSFPAIDMSIYQTDMRNATVTTVAPTGSLHLIADTSSGIEPYFSLVMRRSLQGTWIEITPEVVTRLLSRVRSGMDLLAKVRRTGSVEGLPIPEHIREVLRTAHEIPPEHHVRMQAEVQKYVDNAVSKTVNLPESATPGEVSRIFTLARESGCKGITVYRNNSKNLQVLAAGAGSCKVCD
ncbi:MAG TPA: adenosylcobalamin-dependent ribonucleoside-diphosphate reductase [Methanoregulaceae archaeon]|nr:adenosylcobalamin-dependent ribonucleoside-diphosphate reductase [Methanoregulaceae archaeon]